MLTLILKEGDATQTLKLSQEEITIGRSKENTVVLNNKKVSRKHAKIEQIGASYQVSDLDSGNGTKVNGQKISFPQALTPGDEIKVGDAVLSVKSIDEGDDRIELDDAVSEEEGLLAEETPVSKGATEKVMLDEELTLKDDDIRIEQVEEDLLNAPTPVPQPAPRAASPAKPAPAKAPVPAKPPAAARPKDDIIKLPLDEPEPAKPAAPGKASAPAPAKPGIRFRPRPK